MKRLLSISSILVVLRALIPPVPAQAAFSGCGDEIDRNERELEWTNRNAST